MRKRILSLFCVGALLFTACGQSAATTQTTAESAAAGATEVTTESVPMPQTILPVKKMLSPTGQKTQKS